MDIEARTRRSLEWERLKTYLAAESCCQWSKELCLECAGSTDPSQVEHLLCETDEALSMLAAGFGLSQDGLPELRQVCVRLKAGAQLAASELLSIRRLLLMARRTKARVDTLDATNFPKLIVFATRLFAEEKLVAAISDVFDDDGNLRDDASPLLKSLKRDVSKLNNQTRDELQSIINSSTASKALQEPLYTQRNGRYVLPVQASMRGSIQGIVHDSSASGLTVYVEPFTVVELTNKIKLKEAEIEREIERLLSQLSALATESHESIESSHVALVDLDYIAARARLAAKYKGVKPQLANDGQMSLKQARHPLLVLQNLAQTAPLHVVPNDIMLGGPMRTMIITGPNTGGKTVYLKTAGLLSMMVRCGLLLPVQNGSTAVVFHEVFADIGDEQSIEQNLSTFSSHMTNIIEIVRSSKEGTLVLLDEIGAGTDPREGAILARVILEHLNSCGALTITSSHFGEMKTLAYMTGGFINGSFEFDDNTLSPTYRLRIGVPGSSKAITIASRLGLPAPLVDAAQAFADAGQTDIQEMIDRLEKRLAAMDQAEQEMVERQASVAAHEEKLQAQQVKLEEEKHRLRTTAANEIDTELREARELVRSLIADLQRQPSMPKAQKLQKDLEVLRTQLGWPAPDEVQGTQPPFKVGQQVKVTSLNQKGVIEELPEEGKTGQDALATVRAGSMKIKVALSDLNVIAAAPAQKAGQNKSGGGARSRSHTGAPLRSTTSGSSPEVFVRTAGNTIDLRGQRVDEALQNVERFVDSAYLEHTSPIMIIHGHGTGQLRAAVRDFLRNATYEATWRGGENYEGGDGVTIVQFN